MMAELQEGFNCSLLENQNIVGPFQMYESLGHWTTAVYVILILHVLPIWIVALLTLSRLSSSCSPDLRPSLAWLVCVPPSLMSLITVGILLPSIGAFIEVLLDIIIVIGLLQFIRFSRILSQGFQFMLESCTSKKILLPLGAPPFVCLLAVKQPPVTQRNLSVVMKTPYILLILKLAILIIEIIKVSQSPDVDKSSLEMIKNFASIPVGVVGIYAYTIYLIIVSQLLPQSTQKNLGYILLLQFILSDCTKLFLIFLTGTGMLTCVPPSLSITAAEHIIKNSIRGFITTFVGMPYLKICSEKVAVTQISLRGVSPCDVSSESLSSDNTSLRERHNKK